MCETEKYRFAEKLKAMRRGNCFAQIRDWYIWVYLGISGYIWVFLGLEGDFHADEDFNCNHEFIQIGTNYLNNEDYKD